MSKSYDMLLKIMENIEKNPSFIRELPVKDIVDCIVYELHEIRQLYEPRHHKVLKDRMIDCASEMLNAQAVGDGERALAIFKLMLEQYSMIPDVEVVLPFIERANYDKALNRHIMEGSFIAMGDSHSCFFSGNEDLLLKPVINDINTCEQIENHPFTVLHLGPCLAYSCDRYGSTNRVRERGYRVICYGPIGSLKDNVPLDEYRPRVGTEKQRNQAGRYYNERLENICRENGLEFFTLFYDMVNDDNETDERFLSMDQFHLGQFGYQLAIDKLRKLGLEI